MTKSSRKSSPPSRQKLAKNALAHSPSARARRQCLGAVGWRGVGVPVRARAVLLLTRDGEKVVGPRLVRLLRLIDQHGSVRRATAEMGLSYRHAIAWLQQAEALLGRPLVARHAGGAAGGGASLTAQGRAIIAAYEAVTAEITDVLTRAETLFFPQNPEQERRA